MKSLKNVLAALAFVLAIGATLAFNMKDVTGVDASYKFGVNEICTPSTTITSQCDKDNLGTQCQVVALGAPLAFVRGNCSIPLNKPQGQ